MRVRVIPIDPGGMILWDWDHIIPSLAGTYHVHGVIAMALRRDGEAVEVQVSGLRQVVDETQVQHVARLQRHQGSAIHTVKGGAVDLELAELHRRRARLKRDVQLAVVAAVFGQNGQRFYRRTGRQIRGGTEQVRKRPSDGAAQPAPREKHAQNDDSPESAHARRQWSRSCYKSEV